MLNHARTRSWPVSFRNDTSLKWAIVQIIPFALTSCTSMLLFFLSARKKNARIYCYSNEGQLNKGIWIYPWKTRMLFDHTKVPTSFTALYTSLKFIHTCQWKSKANSTMIMFPLNSEFCLGSFINLSNTYWWGSCVCLRIMFLLADPSSPTFVSGSDASFLWCSRCCSALLIRINRDSRFVWARWNIMIKYKHSRQSSNAEGFNWYTIKYVCFGCQKANPYLWFRLKDHDGNCWNDGTTNSLSVLFK